LALLGSIAVGCSNGSVRFPAETGGPAFDMVVERVSCARDVHATACFRVVITNHGDRGSGSCQLYGQSHRTAPPGDESHVGQRFFVTNLRHNGRVTQSAAWEGSPQDVYRGLCEPGLRS